MASDDRHALLQAFTQAWNHHDIEGLMACMADDCVFVASSGPARDGARHVGREAVRRAFLAVLHDIPDAHWATHRVHLAGTTAFSLWTLTGTRADGSRIEVDGIDHFEFDHGRIKTKNAFRKARSPLPPPAARTDTPA